MLPITADSAAAITPPSGGGSQVVEIKAESAGKKERGKICAFAGRNAVSESGQYRARTRHYDTSYFAFFCGVTSSGLIASPLLPQELRT